MRSWRSFIHVLLRLELDTISSSESLSLAAAITKMEDKGVYWYMIGDGEDITVVDPEVVQGVHLNPLPAQFLNIYGNEIIWSQ